MEHWAQLGAECFEQLQIMKHAWNSNITDMAVANSAGQFEEVDEDVWKECYKLVNLDKENVELDDLGLCYWF